MMFAKGITNCSETTSITNVRIIKYVLEFSKFVHLRQVMKKLSLCFYYSQFVS